MVREKYLMQLQTRLSALNMPIHWQLPKPEVMEPFLVIGYNRGDTLPSAKTNRMIQDDMQQIDIFLPIGIGRLAAEKVQAQAIGLLGKSRYTTTELLMDDSTGRDVWHIVIRLNNLIF